MIKGVNIHQKSWNSSETNYWWYNTPKVIDAAWSLGIRAIRVDCSNSTVDSGTPTHLQRVPEILKLCKDRGIKTQLVFVSPFRFTRTDNGNFADSSAGRYNLGYTLLKQILQNCPIKPDYIELENEITLNVTPAAAWNEGINASYYDTTAYLEYVDLLSGEMQAVKEQSPGSKVIVGTVQGNYGFIPWLISKGINMDIAGYHAYFRPYDDANNWFTLGYKLADVFKSWGKPVTVNELNGNVSLGQPSMGTEAFRGLGILESLSSVESIFVYELFDAIAQPGFGLCDFTSSGFAVRSDAVKIINWLKSKT